MSVRIITDKVTQTLSREDSVQVVKKGTSALISTTADQIEVGDHYFYIGDNGEPGIGTVLEIQSAIQASLKDKLNNYQSTQLNSPNQPKEVPLMSNEAITALEARIQTLEETLIQTNSVVTQLQQSIVQVTAEHMQNIFNSDVTLDTIAHRVFLAGANAIAHKVKSSQERAPELVVVEGYVPGAIRATLLDDDVLIEEQVADSKEWVSGDQLTEGLQADSVKHVFADLLIAYGAHIGQAYYVVESVALEAFRKEASEKALTTIQGVEDTSVVHVSFVGPDGQPQTLEMAPETIVGLVSPDSAVPTEIQVQHLQAGQTILLTNDGQTVQVEVTGVETVI